MTGGAIADRQAVIVISSHVARGSVGNRAAVFALETLGHAVWAVPTIILPWHPGHGRATRIVPPPDAFDALIGDLASSPWLGEVGAVLTGYLGHPGQAPAIARLVRAVKARNPSALYVCDPVIGDLGGLYVAQDTAAAIRDDLFAIADIATPNRYELSWLAGEACETTDDIMRAASSAPPARMLVTSFPASGPDMIGNLWIGDGDPLVAEHPRVDSPPNGLGDLTAALLLARLMAGQGGREALRSTTASVFEVLAKTAAQSADELTLEECAPCLADPAAEVSLRPLKLPEGAVR